MAEQVKNETISITEMIEIPKSLLEDLLENSIELHNKVAETFGRDTEAMLEFIKEDIDIVLNLLIANDEGGSQLDN